MALVADDGLIGVAMTQPVRHIIIMVWGTGLALGYFACIARALRVRAERKIYKGIIFVALGMRWRQRLLFKWRVRKGFGLVLQMRPILLARDKVALAEFVAVEQGDDVREALVPDEIHRLPDLTLA